MDVPTTAISLLLFQPTVGWKCQVSAPPASFAFRVSVWLSVVQWDLPGNLLGLPKTTFLPDKREKTEYRLLVAHYSCFCVLSRKDQRLEMTAHLPRPWGLLCNSEDVRGEGRELVLGDEIELFIGGVVKIVLYFFPSVIEV